MNYVGEEQLLDERRFSETGALSTRVVHGGIWVFSLRLFTRGLAFVRTVILARLLAPEDFGLLGIAMLSLSTLETFSQTGFQTALVQKRENVRSYLDTAWTVSAFRGIVLFAILLVSAPLIAKFFNSPHSILVIRVIAFSSLLSGFRNVGVLHFQKELNFRKQFHIQFSTTIVDLAVAICLAFALRNVWALVWASLAASVVSLVLSYLLHPYRPRIKFEKAKIQELFGFGKWIVGSSILVFLITHGDDMFVAKVIGVTALGLYQMAFTLSNLPATEITHVLSQVTFPAYSKLQYNVSRLREAYLRVLQITTFVSAPLAGGIFILAHDFTQIFLGEKWMPIVPVMKVLAIAGLVRAIAASTGPIFHGLGKPKVETKWQTIRLIVLVVLIYPATSRFGIVGTSIAVLSSIFISTFGFCSEVIRIIGCSTKPFGKLIILPLLNATLMVLILLILDNHLHLTAIYKLLLMTGTGIMFYLLITVFFEFFLSYGIRRLIRENLGIRSIKS